MLKWSEVIQKDEYKALPEMDKAQARVQYFRDVITPQVPEERRSDAMQQFFRDSADMETDKPSAWEHMKATGKAMVNVPMALVGGLVAFPASGLAGGIRAAAEGGVSTEAGKEEFAKGVQETQEMPMWWIKTPEEEQALSYIMKPMEWIDTAATYWGDLAYEKTNKDAPGGEALAANRAAMVKTAVEMAAFFGLPSLIGKLKVAIKTGKTNRINEAIRDVHKERLNVLQNEPDRLQGLASKEAQIAREKTVMPLLKPDRVAPAKSTRPLSVEKRLDTAIKSEPKATPRQVEPVAEPTSKAKEPQRVTPARLTDKIESEQGYAYHATNQERLYEIAETGKLKTHKPYEFTDQDVWPDGATNKRAYLSEKADIVWRFAPEEGRPVVLRTKRTGLKKESTGDIFTDKPILSDKLEYLGEDNNWHPVSRLKETPEVLKDYPELKPTPKQNFIAKKLNEETGSIQLPETQVSRHAKLMSENPALEKVHGMVGEKQSGSHSGLLTKVNTAVFDRFAEIQNKSPKAYEEARIFSSHKDVADIKFRELQDGLRAVRNDELLFTDYVSAHRAMTRAERGLKNPNKVSLQDSRGAIKTIEKAWVDSGKPIEELKASFKNFQEWTDKYILQEARDSGVISKASYDSIKKNNEFYAAFEVIDHLPPDINNIPVLPSKEYFSVSNQKVIKGMIGTEKKILNPIESTVKKFAQAQATFARNKVASTLIDDPLMKDLLRPVADSAKEFAIMKNQGFDPIMDRGWNKTEFDSVNRFKDGRVEKYIAPIELADAMKQLTPHQAPRIVQGVNAAFRASATTLYVPFTISNAMRDGFMAYTTAKVHTSPLSFGKDWVGGAWEGAKHEFFGKSSVVEEYIKSGGGFGFTGEMARMKPSTALFKKGIAGKSLDVVKSPLKLIEKLSATVELAPRVGTYKRAKINGYDTKDAALIARSSTIDFNRGGVYTKVLNQYVPFLNARVQGRVTLATALKNNPMATSAKIMAGVVAPGAAAYAWNRHYFSDLYDDIPEYIRQNYFCIITGKEVNEKGKIVPKYFVISKGDVGQMAWNPIEFGLDKMAKKNPQALQEFAINYRSDLNFFEFAREGEVSV